MRRSWRKKIVEQWADMICYAIKVGDDGAAYRMTRALVERCREMGLWSWR